MSSIKDYIKLLENSESRLYTVNGYVVIILGDLDEDMFSLINDFVSDNTDSIEYSKTRDNCGVVAADFVNFANKRNYVVNRINGHFKVDQYIPSEKDLTRDELIKMRTMDLSVPDDIIYFAKSEGFMDELYYVPHYWNKYNDTIIDFSAYYQFIESGMVDIITTNNYNK